MIIPPLHGKLAQETFFIYTACDTDYFNEFGPTLINSVLQNSKFGIHLHLYNPTPTQLEYCSNKARVSVTYEVVNPNMFRVATQQWAMPPGDPVLAQQYKQILTAMSKGGDSSIQERIQRTYYASIRFARLSQILKPGQHALAIDSDAIVRKGLIDLPEDKDFYIHYISGKKARFLAGGIYFTGSVAGIKFLKEYTRELRSTIKKNILYWGIDQDLLGQIVPKYNYGQLPMEYIDWEMQPDSYIWTAKGTRKELDVFKSEKTKYSDESLTINDLH